MTHRGVHEVRIQCVCNKRDRRMQFFVNIPSKISRDFNVEKGDICKITSPQYGKMIIKFRDKPVPEPPPFEQDGQESGNA